MALVAESDIAALGAELIVLFSNSVFTRQTWLAELSLGAVNLFLMGIWILLLNWFAVLFNRTLPTVVHAQVEDSTPVTEE